MFRLNISDIYRDFYKLSEKYSGARSNSPSYNGDEEDLMPRNNERNSTINNKNTPITIKILSVEDAINEHKSSNGNKQLAWKSFKYHSSTNIEAKYWLGYYYFHDEKIPELQQIDKKVRIQTATEIFKETAGKGNPSAQLRYGMCLWKGEGVDVNSFEALKYLKMAANRGNSAAMYIIGKAYWNGRNSSNGNGIEKDEKQGAYYLKQAALRNHHKAKEMCAENNIK